MVNMNKHKDPCVYALKDDSGLYFYVGRTSINALNRLWEHNYRANNGHAAPVYVRMREIGVENVRVDVLQKTSPDDDAKKIESGWILKLIEEGHPLVNAYGRDGRPDSWSAEQRKRGVPSRRGKETWIKGLHGEAAGWTEERRRAQSERMRSANSNK